MTVCRISDADFSLKQQMKSCTNHVTINARTTLQTVKQRKIVLNAR